MKLSISLNLNDRDFEDQLQKQISDQLGKVIAETADALIADGGVYSQVRYIIEHRAAE